MKPNNSIKLLILFSLAIALLIRSSFSQGFPLPVPAEKIPILSPDAFMRDTYTDTGIEPNPDTGPMWKSPDIWVRKNPDPDWQPDPYPTGTFPWLFPAHESPEYRNPLYGSPNYVYVRVTNRGSAPTTGTERLRVYWAKASTGLAWPDHWTGAPGDDNGDTYYANTCGNWKVFGKEITKPRINAADATPAELARYVQAINDLNVTDHDGTGSGTPFAGIPMFPLQNSIHSSGQHGNDAFLPWHREYVNRYEQMLLSMDPRLTMLYWNWEEDPSNTTSGFDFFSFMGNDAGSVGAPFSTFGISRNFSSGSLPWLDPDSTHYAKTDFSLFRPSLEGGSHNGAHGVIGGHMGGLSTAAMDPFFFLLHTNCDRVWAGWQRDVNNLGRIDQDTAYSPSTSGSLSGTVGPWDGSSSLAPWTTAHGWDYTKTYKHASVVSPPIYDTAPLYVPVMQPGHSAIIQIPWYPPNPDDFACFGDPGHFCLLARIETATSAPYGMTFPEVNNLNTNVRNNNNIVWKNLTVVDDFTGPGISGVTGGVVVRNIDRIKDVQTILRFTSVNWAGHDVPFTEFGEITVDFPPRVLARWIQGGAKRQGVDILDDRTVRITSTDAQMFNIPLEADEAFGLTPHFTLGRDRLEIGPDRAGLNDRKFRWEIQQYGTADNPTELVGGNTYDIDFNKIRLVKPGSQWSYLDLGKPAEEGWHTAEFDDSKWNTGIAGFGHGDRLATPINVGGFRNRLEHGPGLHERQLTDPYVTTYFRHSFQGGDTGEYRSLTLATRADDGVRVFLNGTEIYRSGLPQGDIDYHTPGEPVEGARELQYTSHDVSQFIGLLKPGENIIAAELHQAEGSSDASFDLELFADGLEGVDLPPVVAITGLKDRPYSVKENVTVGVQAVDDGEIVEVRLYLDDEELTSAGDDAQLANVDLQNISVGRHLLRAEAIDGAGNVSSVNRSIQILENLPPLVSIRKPQDRIIVKEGDSVRIEVSADDIDGDIVAVRFLYKSCASPFALSPVVFAEATEPPFVASAQNLHRGSQTVYVEVEDEAGAVTTESVKILAARVPEIQVEVTPAGEMLLVWDEEALQSAKLQSSTNLLDWTDVAQARSPFTVSINEDNTYYHLAYDLVEAVTPETSNEPVFFEHGANLGELGAVLGGGNVNIDVGPVFHGQPGVNAGAGAGAVPVVAAAVAADQWQLPDRDGNQQNLEDFRGKPLVMLFYLGHDCLICLEQLEAMKVAHSAFASAGVNVVAVSPDTVEDLETAQDFPFALLSDADLSVFNSYGVKDADGDPTHAVVIIDGDGQLVLRELGDLPDMNLERILSLAGGQ